MKSFSVVVSTVVLLLIFRQPADAQTQFTAKINGPQQVPGISTSASGTGVFVLSGAGLRFNVTIQGLSGPLLSAHFHNEAFGVNGGIVRTITGDFVGSTASGTWAPTDAEPLTGALVTALKAGNLYVNFHTNANPNGEIRGQVLPSARNDELDGTQQVPSVTTTASGLGFFTLADAGLNFNVTVQGLSGPITQAHFHNGARGANGAIVRTITGDFVGNVASGTWKSTDAEPLTPALVNELKNGNIYVNVHTAANSGGEIRGQIAPPPLASELDGIQQVPAVSTSGSGVGLVTLTPEGLRFNVTIQGLSGGIVAAHFHNGARGANGVIVRTITGDFVGNSASGIWTSTDAEPLTQDLIDALKAGNLYINVHTAAHPDGEIRGQIASPILFSAVLPSSRSVQVGTPATAFGTTINAGTATAVDCQLSQNIGLPLSFTFQTTDPATNAVTGVADRAVDVFGGLPQSFVFAATPTGAFSPTDIPILFSCSNTSNAATNSGLNTLLLSGSTTPTPDIVALAATIGNDGIVNIPGTGGTGVFSVATVNVGASGAIVASADTGAVGLPVAVTLCQTNPPTGLCISSISSSVTTTINASETPTFGIFVTGSGNVDFSPAVNRIFVRFKDEGGDTRGSTSVAVRTQ